MRGVAALSVVCGHAVTANLAMGINRDFALGALSVLQSGVDIFFVISGFIIGTAASEIGAREGRRGAIGFAIKRFARIYPLYWIVLAAAVLSSRWVVTGSPSASSALDTILLNTATNYFIPPAWSLCFEVYFYAGVTALLVVSPKHVLPVALAAVATLAAVDALPIPQLLFVFSNPLTIEFGFGLLIALLLRRRVVAAILPCLLGSAALFSIGGFLHVHGEVPTALRVATYGTAAGLLIYAVVGLEVRGARFPRGLQLLGDISYSLYVWHFLLLTWLANHAFAGIPHPLQPLAWVVIVVGAAALSYRYLERPIMRATMALAPPSSETLHVAPARSAAITGSQIR